MTKRKRIIAELVVQMQLPSGSRCGEITNINDIGYVVKAIERMTSIVGITY